MRRRCLDVYGLDVCASAAKKDAVPAQITSAVNASLSSLVVVGGGWWWLVVVVVGGGGGWWWWWWWWWWLVVVE